MLQYLHVYYMCALLKGLHPRIVTEGFELAKDKALEVRFFFLKFYINCRMVCCVIMCHVTVHLFT